MVYKIPHKVIFLAFLFICLIEVFSPTFVSCTPISLIIESDNIAGSEKNEGLLVIDGDVYDLKASLTLENGVHSILYVPMKGFVFDSWSLKSSSNKMLMGNDENINLLNLTVSDTVVIKYNIAPEMIIEVIEPKPGYYVSAKADQVEYVIKVRDSEQAIVNAYVKLHINNSFIGSGFSDNEGLVKIVHNKPKADIYELEVTAEKKNYQDTIHNEIFDRFYFFKMTPKNNEIYTSEKCTIMLGLVSIKNAINGTEVELSVNDEKKSLITGPNGYCSHIFEPPNYGTNNFEADFTLPSGQEIHMNKVFFDYFKDLIVSSYEVTSDDYIDNNNPKIRLGVITSAYGQYVDGVEVSFIVDGLEVGTNTTDVEGHAYFDYQLLDDRVFSWEAVGSKEGYLDDASSSKIVNLNEITIKNSEFTKIKVVNQSVTSKRVNIGDKVSLGFKLEWENGDPVQYIDVEFSNNVMNKTNKNGWVYLSVKKDYVYQEVFYIKNIPSNSDLEIINIKSSTIIWDKIILDIKSVENRYSINSEGIISHSGYYAFSGEEYEGNVFFNTDLTQSEVSKKTVFIDSIEDNKHGLSVFDCNNITVIWDEIVLSLSDNVIYEANNVKDVTVKGNYAYDGSDFFGTIDYTLPDINEPGEYKVKIHSINDYLYDVSSINQNNLLLNFDVIELAPHIIDMTPGKSKLQINTGNENTSKLLPVSFMINEKEYEFSESNGSLIVEMDGWFLKRRIEGSVRYNNGLVRAFALDMIHYENIITGIFSLSLFLVLVFTFRNSELLSVTSVLLLEKVHEINIRAEPNRFLSIIRNKADWCIANRRTLLADINKKIPVLIQVCVLRIENTLMLICEKIRHHVSVCLKDYSQSS